MLGIIHRLLRFCGCGGTPKPPSDFRGDDPFDWVIHLEGRWMPRGGKTSIRVLLNESSTSGRAEIHNLPHWRDKMHHGRELVRELTPLEVARILDMLSSLFPTQIASVKNSVFDGMPSTLIIHRRELYLVVAAKCNMTEWIPEAAELLHPGVEIPPVAKIGWMLLDIRREELERRGKQDDT